MDHRYVHIDNEGRNVPVPSIIMQEDEYEYEFDEMELTGEARLWFYHPTDADVVTVVVHRFIGDRTGRAHLRSNQKVFVEFVESESNVTEAPCSYWIDYEAEIILPTEVNQVLNCNIFILGIYFCSQLYKTLISTYLFLLLLVKNIILYPLFNLLLFFNLGENINTVHLKNVTCLLLFILLVAFQMHNNIFGV